MPRSIPDRRPLSGVVLGAGAMHRFAVPFVVGLAAAVAGCNRTEENLPEWRPSDHDNAATPSAAQVDTKQPRPGMPNLEKYGLNEVIIAAWKQNCVPCHGIIGRGDGPQAAMSRPRDLTDPNWQRAAPDDEILYAIQKGRGRMPPFPALPEDTARGLVRMIRLMNADGPPPEAPGSDAPSSDAPHGAPPAASAPATKPAP